MGTFIVVVAPPSTRSSAVRMLVVFNATYGNTKIIADTIVAGLGDGAMAIPVSSVGSSNLGGVDLLAAP